MYSSIKLAISKIVFLQHVGGFWGGVGAPCSGIHIHTCTVMRTVIVQNLSVLILVLFMLGILLVSLI